MNGAGNDGTKLIVPPLLNETMYRPILFIFAITLTSVLSFSVAATFTGNVVSVLHGDTINVLHNRRAEL